MTRPLKPRSYDALSLTEASKSFTVFAEDIRKALTAYTEQRRFRTLKIQGIGDVTDLASPSFTCLHERLAKLRESFDAPLHPLMQPSGFELFHFICSNPPDQFENLDNYLLAALAHFFCKAMSEETPVAAVAAASASSSLSESAAIELFFAGLQKLATETLPAAVADSSVVTPAAGGAGAAAAAATSGDETASAEKKGVEFNAAPLARLMLLQLSQTQKMILPVNAEILASEMNFFKREHYFQLVEEFNRNLVGAVHFALSQNLSTAGTRPVAYEARQFPPLVDLLRVEMAKLGLALADEEGLRCFTENFSEDSYAVLSLEFDVLTAFIGNFINDPNSVLADSPAAPPLKERYQKLIQLLQLLKGSSNSQLADAAKIYYEAFIKLPYFEDPAAIPSLEEVQAEVIYRYCLRDSDISAALARSTATEDAAAPAPVPVPAIPRVSPTARLTEIEASLRDLRIQYGQAQLKVETAFRIACSVASAEYELAVDSLPKSAAVPESVLTKRDGAIKEAEAIFEEKARALYLAFKEGQDRLLAEKEVIDSCLRGETRVTAAAETLAPVPLLKPDIGALIKELFERNFKALQQRFVAQYCAYRDQVRFTTATGDSSITPELAALIDHLATTLGLDKNLLTVQVLCQLQEALALARAGDGRAMIGFSFLIPVATADSGSAPAMLAAAPRTFGGLFGWGGHAAGVQVTQHGSRVELRLGLNTAISAAAIPVLGGAGAASTLVPAGERGWFARLFGGGTASAPAPAPSVPAAAGAGVAKR